MASSWRHVPWLLGLALAPLLGGSVGIEGKAVVGLLLSLSLFLVALHAGGRGDVSPIIPAPLRWAAFVCVVIALVPLPRAWIEILSPQHAALTAAFPIDAGIEAPSKMGWSMLTLSPARTVERLAEVLLFLTAFSLARRAAAHAGLGRQLVWTIAIAIGLMALTEIWVKLSGTKNLFGLWSDPAGHAGATFANRNHFASWVYVGGFLVVGWIIRQVAPLQAARAAASASLNSTGLREAAVLLVIVSLGFATAVGSGSRGALLALTLGFLTWILLLSRRAHRRGRWFALGAVTLLMLVVLLSVGGYLSNRLETVGSDLAFKASLWRDSWNVFLRFPWWGTGPGTFSVVFGHFKTFGGAQTFLHAENEVVQLWVEQGMVGTAILGGALIVIAVRTWHLVARERMAEPELVFGACAGLIAFAAHALVEFVWQIPANALLAATLLGFVVGTRDAGRCPAVPLPPSAARVSLNFSWAIGLCLLALVQGASWFYAHRAEQAASIPEIRNDLRRSVQLWPWAPGRRLALIKAEIAGVSPETLNGLAEVELQRVRETFSQALTADPYSWPLRLELAWFELFYGTQPTQAVTKAWEVVRLNPLQPQIPLQFAQYLARIDPVQAERFLRAVSTTRADEQRQVLELAWQLNPDPTLLWPYTPDTPQGLRVLAEFAQQHKLPQLAAQATARISFPMP